MRTETQTKTETETLVAEEDLDDVIELAARMMQEEEGALTDAEVKEVALELDIPEAYIDRARAKLKEVKAQKQRELKEQQIAKKKKIVVASGIGLALIALISINNAGVGSLHAKVVSQQAQVTNVKERGLEVEQMLASRPASPDKDAELIGTKNRIRVETKRYNELAAKYNARAGGVVTSFTLIFSSLPDRVVIDP